MNIRGLGLDCNIRMLKVIDGRICNIRMPKVIDVRILQSTFCWGKTASSHPEGESRPEGESATSENRNQQKHQKPGSRSSKSLLSRLGKDSQFIRHRVRYAGIFGLL